jgi:hypothetical protein
MFLKSMLHILIMDDIWIVIVSTSLGGIFALLGVSLQYYFSVAISNKKKKLEVIEDFLKVYVEYFRGVTHLFYFLEHLDDKFEIKFLGITKDMPTVERYIRISEAEMHYQSEFRNFTIGYSKLRLYIKDDFLDKKLSNFADFIDKTEELFPKTRDIALLESLLKDKKALDEYKKKMTDLFKGHINDLRELHDYLITKKF